MIEKPVPRINPRRPEEERQEEERLDAGGGRDLIYSLQPLPSSLPWTWQTALW